MKDKLFVMRAGYHTDGLIDLIKYIDTFNPTNEMSMIEIGSYSGESTEIFSKYFKTVTSIDPFINDYDISDQVCDFMDLTDVYFIFKEKIDKLPNVNHIRKTSDDAYDDLKEQQFDFVYIDGLHTYDQVIKDITNYKKIIKNGGYLAGHDYHENWSGVYKAVNEIIVNPDMIFSDTSWIKKIPF